MPLFPLLHLKKNKKEEKTGKQRAQINIAAPLVRTDDVITRLSLLGRPLRPPEGNSGTQKREQHIAQAIFISVRVVQHIFAEDTLLSVLFPPTHGSTVVLVPAGRLHASGSFPALLFTQNSFRSREMADYGCFLMSGVSVRGPGT